jgi:hypothetical protein
MAQTVKVDIQNMKFNPTSVPITQGDTVEWTNRMGMPHTVKPDHNEFPSSGAIAPNKTFSHVFDVAGTIAYHCEIHPIMKGTVIVSPQSDAGPTYTPEIGRKFWFTFDAATKYNPAFINIIIAAGGFGVQDDFESTRSNGTYPAAFKQKFVPLRDNWVRIADVQTSTIANVLGANWSDIQAAFEDFGQGTLLDTDPVRQQNNDSIHMMDVQDNTSPPGGYHRWHASIRAIQLLEIGDPVWWERLDSLVGLAWAVQSFARPKQQTTANPGIAASDLQDLRNAWLPLTAADRDRQYDAVPGGGGYHPSPKQPVA